MGGRYGRLHWPRRERFESDSRDTEVDVLDDQRHDEGGVLCRGVGAHGHNDGGQGKFTVSAWEIAVNSVTETGLTTPSQSSWNLSRF